MTDQPPTLRDVLDRGEDLSKYVSLKMFKDDIRDITEWDTKLLRARMVHFLMDWQRLCEGAGFTPERSPEIICEELWTIELIDNPDLMPRVVAALPAEPQDSLRRRRRRRRRS